MLQRGMKDITELGALRVQVTGWSEPIPHHELVQPSTINERYFK